MDEADPTSTMDIKHWQLPSKIRNKMVKAISKHLLVPFLKLDDSQKGLVILAVVVSVAVTLALARQRSIRLEQERALREIKETTTVATVILGSLCLVALLRYQQNRAAEKVTEVAEPQVQSEFDRLLALRDLCTSHEAFFGPLGFAIAALTPAVLLLMWFTSTSGSASSPEPSSVSYPGKRPLQPSVIDDNDLPSTELLGPSLADSARFGPTKRSRRGPSAQQPKFVVEVRRPAEGATMVAHGAVQPSDIVQSARDSPSVISLSPTETIVKVFSKRDTPATASHVLAAASESSDNGQSSSEMADVAAAAAAASEKVVLDHENLPTDSSGNQTEQEENGFPPPPPLLLEDIAATSTSESPSVTLATSDGVRRSSDVTNNSNRVSRSTQTKTRFIYFNA
jgi:hypothetical protein